MATTELSMTVKHEALEMALQSHTWNRGTSKRTGEPFWIIPSRSEKNVAHWVALDARGCTCRGHRRHGDCAHAEAVRMHNGHQRATERVSAYEALFPAECVERGCTKDAAKGERFCSDHLTVDAF